MKSAALVSLRVVISLASLASIALGGLFCASAFPKNIDIESACEMLIGVFLIVAGILFLGISIFSRNDAFQRYLRQMLDGL